MVFKFDYQFIWYKYYNGCKKYYNVVYKLKLGFKLYFQLKFEIKTEVIKHICYLYFFESKITTYC